MVRIDCAYRIPAPRQTVWEILTRPELEHEHTWLMSNANEILERRVDGVRFRTHRERSRAVKRPDAVSVFDGVFDPDAWRIRWRIVEGFEKGSEYVEELSEELDGDNVTTRVRAHGRISLEGVEWDWRILGTLAPWKARALVERNLCRDYKGIKRFLQAQGIAREDAAASDENVSRKIPGEA